MSCCIRTLHGRECMTEANHWCHPTFIVHPLIASWRTIKILAAPIKQQYLDCTHGYWGQDDQPFIVRYKLFWFSLEKQHDSCPPPDNCTRNIVQFIITKGGYLRHILIPFEEVIILVEPSGKEIGKDKECILEREYVWVWVIEVTKCSNACKVCATSHKQTKIDQVEWNHHQVNPSCHLGWFVLKDEEYHNSANDQHAPLTDGLLDKSEMQEFICESVYDFSHDLFWQKEWV